MSQQQQQSVQSVQQSRAVSPGLLGVRGRADRNQDNLSDFGGNDAEGGRVVEPGLGEALRAVGVGQVIPARAPQAVGLGGMLEALEEAADSNDLTGTNYQLGTRDVKVMFRRFAAARSQLELDERALPEFRSWLALEGIIYLASSRDVGIEHEVMFRFNDQTFYIGRKELHTILWQTSELEEVHLYRLHRNLTAERKAILGDANLVSFIKRHYHIADPEARASVLDPDASKVKYRSNAWVAKRGKVLEDSQHGLAEAE